MNASSINLLLSLAEEVGVLDNNVSKPKLFEILQSQYDLNRLDRVRRRGLKRNQQLMVEDSEVSEGVIMKEVDNPPPRPLLKMFDSFDDFYSTKMGETGSQ
jgi:hypothetical protein